MLNQHPKKHRHAGTPNSVRDPLVDPGNPSHRYQARSTAHLDRPRSRMVALAASPPGPRSPRSPQAENATVMLESVSKLQQGLQSFRSMRRMEASFKNARALRLRFSQSLARRRQRLSQAIVRSTIQRLGNYMNPLA